MPLTDEGLNVEVLTDETLSSGPVDQSRSPADETHRRMVPAPARVGPDHGNGQCVAAATMAFLAAFLVSGFFAGTVRGGDWASALASAFSFGLAGAGFQLLLMAVRQRRELEADAEI